MIYLHDIPLDTFLKYFTYDKIGKYDSKYIPLYTSVMSGWYVHSFPGQSIEVEGSQAIPRTMSLYTHTGYPIMTTDKQTDSLLKHAYRIQTPTEVCKYINVKAPMYKTPLYAKDAIDTFKYVPSKYSLKRSSIYVPSDTMIVENKNGEMQAVDINQDNNSEEMAMIIYTNYELVYPVFDATGDGEVRIYDFSLLPNTLFTKVQKYLSTFNNENKYDLGKIIYDYILSTGNQQDLAKCIAMTCKYKEITSDNNKYYDIIYRNNYGDNDDRQYKQWLLYGLTTDTSGNIVESELGILFENIEYQLPDYVIINGITHIHMLNTAINKDLYIDANNIPTSKFSDYVTMLNAYKNLYGKNQISDTSIPSYIASDIFPNNSLIYIDTANNTYKVYIKADVVISPIQNPISNGTLLEYDLSNMTDEQNQILDTYSEYEYTKLDDLSGNITQNVIVDCTYPVLNYLNDKNLNALKDSINELLITYVTDNDESIYNNGNPKRYRDLCNQCNVVEISYNIGNDNSVIDNIINIELLDEYLEGLRNGKTITLKELFRKKSLDTRICYYTPAAITDNRGKELPSSINNLNKNSMLLLGIHALSEQHKSRFSGSNIINNTDIFKQHIYNKGIKKLYSKSYDEIYNSPKLNVGGQYYDKDGNKHTGFASSDKVFVSYITRGLDDIDNDDIIEPINIDSSVLDNVDIEAMDKSNQYQRITEFDKYPLAIDRINAIKDKLITEQVNSMTESSINLSDEITSNNSDAKSFARKYNSIYSVSDVFINSYAGLYEITSKRANEDTMLQSVQYALRTYINNVSPSLNDSDNIDLGDTRRTETMSYKIAYSTPITIANNTITYNQTVNNNNFNVFKQGLLSKLNNIG